MSVFTNNFLVRVVDEQTGETVSLGTYEVIMTRIVVTRTQDFGQEQFGYIEHVVRAEPYDKG